MVLKRINFLTTDYRVVFSVELAGLRVPQVPGLSDIINSLAEVLEANFTGF